MEKTIDQIERTIQYVAREIRRSKNVNQKDILALAKLTSAYANLLEKEPEEWNYELDGDPYIHEEFEQEDQEGGHERRKIIRRHDTDD